MKTHIYIIRVDRSVKELDVDSTKGVFKFNQGIYCITNASTLRARENPANFNTVPELFYFEKNPLPLTETVMKDADFLENMVIENALRDTGKPRYSWLMNTLSGLISNPIKLMGLLVAIGVGLILLRVAIGNLGGIGF